MNPHPQHSGHTAGEWKTKRDAVLEVGIDCDGRDYACLVRNSEIGLAVAQARGDSAAEAEANARLIAAAPALLEACKDMLTTARSLYRLHYGKDAGNGGGFGKAESAIALATQKEGE